MRAKISEKVTWVSLGHLFPLYVNYSLKRRYNYFWFAIHEGGEWVKSYAKGRSSQSLPAPWSACYYWWDIWTSGQPCTVTVNTPPCSDLHTTCLSVFFIYSGGYLGWTVYPVWTNHQRYLSGDLSSLATLPPHTLRYISRVKMRRLFMRRFFMRRLFLVFGLVAFPLLLLTFTPEISRKQGEIT